MIQIIVQSRDGGIEIILAETKGKAYLFCKEEVKWESTLRVICNEICFDQFGDYCEKHNQRSNPSTLDV